LTRASTFITFIQMSFSAYMLPQAGPPGQQMNRFDTFFGLTSQARVRYGDGDFTVLSAGDFVRCAVTGEAIPLPNLKYWSVERQEAYASAEVSLKRYLEVRNGTLKR
jgi:hypothetical protein